MECVVVSTAGVEPHQTIVLLEDGQSQCPDPYPEGRCGWQAGGKLCPNGACCSYSGWCGTARLSCRTDFCQSQCATPFPRGRWGWQAAGRGCPNGVCCSVSGWCGTTSDYCAPDKCQKQCKTPSPPPPSPSPPPPSPPPPSPPPPSPSPPPPSPPPPPPPNFPPGRCGRQAGGRLCPKRKCCSRWGWCGTTPEYCADKNCQSQCRNYLTSSAKNDMGGLGSF
ncbi:chitin-binding lectin 1-like [Capsicum galapagoense]